MVNWELANRSSNDVWDFFGFIWTGNRFSFHYLPGEKENRELFPEKLGTFGDN